MPRFLWLVLSAALTVATVPARGDPDRDDRWVEIAPPARAEHVAAYDRRHRRLILFGGQVDGTLRNDLWVLSLAPDARWKRARPEGEGPSPRSGAAAVYDSRRDRLLLFGGRDSTGHTLDELWEIVLHGRPTWRRLSTPGLRPAARWRATLTLDPEGDSAVLYGGAATTSYAGQKLGDAWRLALDHPSWAPIIVEGAPPDGRTGHTAVYCPDLRGVLVFGGEVIGSIPGCFLCRRPEETAELWLLALGPRPEWHRLTATSSEGPCEVQGHIAFWDGASHRMLMSDGGSFWRVCAVSNATVWAFDVRTLAWSRLAPHEPWPRARFYPATFFDPAFRRLYLHGGERTLMDGGCLADTWTLSVEGDPVWRRIVPAAHDPPSTGFPFYATPATVYDSLRDRILFDTGSGIWVYAADTGAWTPLVTTGAAPPAHSGGVAVLDGKRDRLLVYGGRDPMPPANQTLQDVWELSLADPPSWSKLPTVGGGPASLSGAAVYDAVRDRMLVWTPGGSSASLPGLWALPLGGAGAPGWQLIMSAFDSTGWGPGSLGRATVVYDSRRDRLVLFGGGVESSDGWSSSNGCWALPLSESSSWQLLSPPQYFPAPVATRPSPRASAGGVYDPVGDRLIILGGHPSGWYYHIPDDAWALAFQNNDWILLQAAGDPHPAWMNAVAVYDSRRRRTLVFQESIVWGFESGPPWRTRLVRPGVRPTALLASDLVSIGLGGAHPNPSSDQVSIRFTLPDAGPATLELLDLAGRRVWTHDVGALGAGAHSVQVSSARGMAPGVYLVRLMRGDATRVSKLVRLRR